MSSIGEYLALKRTQRRMTQQEVSDALKDRGIIRHAKTPALDVLSRCEYYDE